MEQIPEIHKESLDQFDSKLLKPALQKPADKRRKDHFKRLIAGCIGVSHASHEGSQSYAFAYIGMWVTQNQLSVTALTVCGGGGGGGLF